jgi:putative aldouronate transport system substrate-binding protein
MVSLERQKSFNKIHIGGIAMKFKKAIVPMFLVLIFVLAACGGNQAVTPPPTTTATPGATTAAPTTPVGTPPADLTVEEMTGFLAGINPVQASWPLTTTPGPHFRVFAQVSGATVEDMPTNAFTHWYQEQTGVEIEWMTVTSGAGQQIPLMIAAGDLPDMFLGNVGTMQLQTWALLDQVFQPLTESIFRYGYNFVNMLRNYPQTRQHVFMPDGNIYSLLRVVDTFNERVNKRAWIYEPWLDLLGADLPVTTEEFYDLMVRFRDEIPALIGVDSVVPLAGALQGNPANNEPESFFMNSFIFYSRDHFIRILEDGRTLEFVADTEEFRDGLRYMNRLYSSGLLSSETWTHNRSGLMHMTEGGDQNILGAVTAMFWGHFTTEGGPLGRDLDFITIPVLEGPQGVRLAYDRGMLINNGMLIATTANPNVDLTIQWADWFFDPFAMMDAGYSSVLGPVDVGWRHALPGELDVHGNQALYAYLRPPDNPQNDAWFQVLPYFWPASFIDAFVNDESNRKEGWGGEQTRINYYPYSAFDQRLPFLFTPFEHLDEFNRLQSDLTHGTTGEIRVHISRFMTGELDINNDAHWNAYVQLINRLGAQRWLELYQEMFDDYLASQAAR